MSILHRISGALMFVLMPFIIWMFDTSVSSEYSFARFVGNFKAKGLWGLPGVFWKLVALALIWAYLHHFIAGLRHLWMDISHEAVSKGIRQDLGRGHAGVEHPADAALGASCSACTDKNKEDPICPSITAPSALWWARTMACATGWPSASPAR